MKKLGWVVLPIAISVLCFIVSYSYATHRNATLKPEIVVNSMPITRTVTWYTSVPLTDANRITNVFKLKTNIDVKIVRDSALIIRGRLISEVAAGKTEADVTTIADIGTFVELKNQGYLLKYDSPQYEHYSKEDKDPGYWAIFTAFGICMAYDSNRIAAPPQHWIDLLDNTWKGRIGLEDINTAGSQYCQYYILREKLGTGFWKQLLSVQEPRIYYKTEDLANALLSGQVDIAGEFSTYTVYNYKINKGTTIQGIYPEEGIPLVVTPIAIINGTSHIEEAKLFLDFLLSQEGQEVTQRLSYSYSIRGGVLPIKGIPSFSDLAILRPKNAIEYGIKRNDYIQEFNSFLESNRRK